MRRFRRAVVISLLCLTTFVASAAAGGAWVLWSETTSPDPLHAGWRVLDASETEAACRLALRKHIEFHRQTWSGSHSVEFRASEASFMVTTRDQAGVVQYYALVSLYCLPDTVDPRGPGARP